jgi:hypothetical protein
MHSFRRDLMSQTVDGHRTIGKLSLVDEESEGLALRLPPGRSQQRALAGDEIGKRLAIDIPVGRTISAGA